MAKTEITTEKVEIIKQIKLTSNQRLALTEMQNHEGRSSRTDYRVGWAERVQLQALGLIEEREGHTPGERRAIEAEIRNLWMSIPSLTKAKDINALDRVVDSIRSKQSELTSKAWWLTDAANEYLTKGKVVITR